MELAIKPLSIVWQVIARMLTLRDDDNARQTCEEDGGNKIHEPEADYHSTIC